MIVKRTLLFATRLCTQFTRPLSNQNLSGNLAKYKQGQSFTNDRGKSIREYFYYIDHHGQVDPK